MNDTEKLNVWYNSLLVGEMWRNATTNKLYFRYDTQWLKQGFPISQQMPFNQIEYTNNEIADKFFSNLLPEGHARQNCIKDLKIPDTHFDLLRAIGGECAGALSILPAGQVNIMDSSYKKISDKMLNSLILRRGNITSFISEKIHPRLSLAGAQNKCPIKVENNKYYIPIGNAPTTHILKFEVPDYANVPLYECFLNKLANSINLPTVETSFIQLEKHQYLLIKRYDRIYQNNGIKRLHQEDLCQALGYYSYKKYQMDGGPSFSDCYHLLKNISKNPIQDSENLLKWQIFNYLAGNSDGHAKNIALLYDHNTVSLAPFYDIVCTRAIASIDRNLAFSIGDMYDPGEINPLHWNMLAKNCNIRPEYLNSLLISIAENLLHNVKRIKNEFEENYGSYPALQRITYLVTKQCNKTLKLIRSKAEDH